ncbi:hypothetical protein MHYP_G00192350 [Metynnis hypsauchen]
MDSTKKVTKKLAGAAARTAAWETNVGNEHGQLHQPEAHCTGGRRLRRRTKRSCRKQAVRFQLDSPATSVDSQRGLSLAT